MKPIRLRAYHNVADLAEERRLREQREGELFDDLGFRVMFVGFRARETANAPQAAPARRQRAKWLRALLGLVKRSRPS